MAHQHLPSPLPVSFPTCTTNDHNPTGRNYQTGALDGRPLWVTHDQQDKKLSLLIRAEVMFSGHRRDYSNTAPPSQSPSTITTSTTNHMSGGHCQDLGNLLHHSPGCIRQYQSKCWHSIAREIRLMSGIVLINAVLLHVPCLSLQLGFFFLLSLLLSSRHK